MTVTLDLTAITAANLLLPPPLDYDCGDCGAFDGDPCTDECRTAGLLDEIRTFAEGYLDYRRRAANRTPNSFYDFGFAHHVYGEGLARLLGCPDLDGQELADAAEAVLAILDAAVNRLADAAGLSGDPWTTAVAYCVYGAAALPIPA